MRKLLLFTAILPAVGCVPIRPIGPLAEQNVGAVAKRGPDGTKTVVMPPKDAVAMPAEAEGPKPPAPSYQVTPAEVTDATAKECADKLRKELEADRATADAMPRYPEVSRVKR